MAARKKATRKRRTPAEQLKALQRDYDKLARKFEGAKPSDPPPKKKLKKPAKHGYITRDSLGRKRTGI